MFPRFLAGCGVLGLFGCLFSGCSSPQGAGYGTGNGGSPVFPAHFQATVYDVEGDIASIDARSLEKRAASPEELLSALSRFGKARVLYRFDQRINVFSERLTIGSREPVVTGSRVGQTGQAINMVRYEEVGAVFNISADPASRAKRPNVKISAEVAALGGGEVRLSPGAKAPSVQRVSIEHQEPLEFGRTRVMVASSSAAPSPRAYVTRYVFNK